MLNGIIYFCYQYSIVHTFLMNNIFLQNFELCQYSIKITEKIVYSRNAAAMNVTNP